MVDDAALPDTVWVEYFTDTNKSYFYNKETKQTTWKVPSDYLLWKETAVKAYLKTTNWKRTVDKKDKVYYYDKVTKVTQWDVPGDVIDFEMGLLKANLKRHESRKRKAKDVTTDLKERAADVAPLIDKASKDDSIFEATIPVSKIRKRVAEVDDEYESNNNNDQLRKDIPKAAPAKDRSDRFEKKTGAKNRVVDNDYTDSDHEEHYSQENDEYKGHVEHQKRSTEEKGTDYQTVSEGQKLQDEETAFFNNDDDRDVNAEEKQLAQQDGSPTPEQKTPQYQESTPQGTPQYQESTPQGTPQYQESTPQGTPQYQESTPQGTPQYQESTPQGTPQYQESTPQATPDNEYGGYGNDEENEDLKERARSHAEGDIHWSQFHNKNSSTNAESDTNELSTASKEKEEKKLQEEMDFMKTLDLKFQEKDAIMELSVCDTIRTYMECQKGKNPEVIIRIIADSYTGHAQMSHIVAEWLSLAVYLDSAAPQSNPAPSSSSSTTVAAVAPVRGSTDSEAAVVEHLAAMIKVKFDTTLADSIIPKLRDTPEWLKQLMGDKTFRKMLIELHDQNRNSTLIKIALKEICRMGHHREIALVIRDLDYFDVFNDSDLLVDVLVRLSQAEDDDLKDLLEVLARMCCNTEYMFLYTMELLAKVDEKLGGEISIDYWRSMLDTSSKNSGDIVDNISQSKDDIINNDRNSNDNNSNNNNNNSNNNNSNNDNDVSSNSTITQTAPSNTQNSSKSSLIDTNQKHQNSSISVECPIPSSVRQRRRLRRFRQELEASTVWCKRDRSTSASTNQGQYALRLLSSITRNNSSSSSGSNSSSGGNSSSGSSSNSSSSSSSSSSVGGEDRMRRHAGSDDSHSAVVNIVGDILKYNQVTAVHVDRLHSLCSGSGDAHHGPTSSSSSLSSSSPNGTVLSLLPILRDPLLLDLLITAFIHPSKQLPSPAHNHTAKLLAVICGSYYEENPELGDQEDKDKRIDDNTALKELESALLTAREICNELSKTAIGVSSYDRPTQLLSLLHHPIVSMCTLRWMAVLLSDADFTRKTVFLSVLPAFLQLMVEAGIRHPFQWQDCFELYKMILMLSPADQETSESSKRFQASAETYTIVTGQKDAMDCLVHLMGGGFTSQPMDFLSSHLAGLDAVLVRHLVRTLLHSVKPPLSLEFAVAMMELLTSASSRKAITSIYFPRSDAILLKDFYDNIITSKLFEFDSNSSLNAIANSGINGSSDGYGHMNSTSSISQSCMGSGILDQVKGVVMSCSSIHKL